MPRNLDIQRIFEIADDSLQGLLGYYLYTTSATECAQQNCILSKLPEDRIPITHAWDRFYQPNELIAIMENVFVSYQTRVCLAAMVNIFEVSSRSFANCLEQAGHPQTIPDNPKHYKNRLKWIFQKVAVSTIPDQKIQARITDLCLDVDHGRRLRNISVHNNGLFDNRYGNDCIQIAGHNPLIHPDYQHYIEDKNEPVPMILSPLDYLQLSKSHIELLHVLHYEIQRQDFGDPTGYSYRDEKKAIEWHRILLGY
ncbi:MAG: hypothetical protein GTO24_24235 [candidate division Zixibacteria bacterium]|nr:hypothetical protein [candidate division Zixibacteria bacterium]